MIILDDSNQPIQSECHFLTTDGSFQVAIESSGSGTQKAGVAKRNPEYQKLLFYVLKRIGICKCDITRIYLDSANKTVQSAPINERIIPIEIGYPFSTHLMEDNEIEKIRQSISRSLSLMFRNPAAKSKSGNSQKRIVITLSKPLLFSTFYASQPNPTKEFDLLQKIHQYSNTEVLAMQKARRGQGIFKKQLLRDFRCRCAINGIQTPCLLIASHIKPWEVCSHQERLNPLNGLLLSPIFDKLFDNGLMSFDSEGRILISKRLGPEEINRCGINSNFILPRHEIRQCFLEYHRTIKFQR